MNILERNTLHYMTPRPFCPRNAYEFIVEATPSERTALLQWCEENGCDLRIRAGISWGRDYVVKAIAFTQSKADRLRGFIAQWGEPVAPRKLDLSEAKPPVDPLAVWAVAALAEMKAKTA